ncbi:MAG TPA: hypothetical protein VNE16_15180, partial [Vicinamibacterales bacterium]|nr:hypothetical protein [Vicinamibacterales bacterium]
AGPSSLRSADPPKAKEDSDVATAENKRESLPARWGRQSGDNGSSGPMCGAGAELQFRTLVVLAFDEANLAGARPLGGFFNREFDPLPLAQQLEHRTANGAAMEEVLDAPFIADEAEAFVDEEPCNRARRHTRVLRDETP